MNIFNRSESFLPELKLYRSIQLSEASVEMVLQGIRVGEVDAVRLVRILRDIGQVKTEGLAQATKLDLALVLQAELEGLLRDLLSCE